MTFEKGIRRRDFLSNPKELKVYFRGVEMAQKHPGYLTSIFPYDDDHNY